MQATGASRAGALRAARGQRGAFLRQAFKELIKEKRHQRLGFFFSPLNVKQLFVDMFKRYLVMQNSSYFSFMTHFSWLFQWQSAHLYPVNDLTGKSLVCRTFQQSLRKNTHLEINEWSLRLVHKEFNSRFQVNQWNIERYTSLISRKYTFFFCLINNCARLLYLSVASVLKSEDWSINMFLMKSTRRETH